VSLRGWWLRRRRPSDVVGCCGSRLHAVERLRSVNSFGKNLALWIIIVLLVMLLFNLFQNTTNRGGQQEVLYSDFLNDVNRHQITSVKIQGNTITGTRTGGGCLTTHTPPRHATLRSIRAGHDYRPT